MKLPLSLGHGLRHALNRNFKWLNLTGLLTALLLFAATSAEASHYRYGTISWKRIPGSCSVEVTVKQAWRMSAFFAGTPAIGAHTGTTTTLYLYSHGGSFVGSSGIDLTVTSVNPAQDWFFGEYKDTFLLPSCDTTYLFFYEDCCRISTLINNADDYFRSESVVTPYSSGNNSPVSSQTPIVKLGTGLAAAMFPLSGIDPDGDPVTFRLATKPEAGGGSASGFNHPDFSVSAGGMGTFSTVGKTIGNQYNVWYAVEDSHGSKIIGDFLIEIVAAGSAPTFDYAVTPSPASCIMAKPGDLVTYMVKADDPDAGDSVFLSAVGVPPLATHSPTLPTSPHKPDSTVFSWVPGPGDVGTTVITYTAEDDAGLQTSTTVCIEVKADSAQECVARDSLSSVTDTSWRKSTVVTPSTNSGTWSGVSGVLPSDATYTLDVPIGQPYPFPSIDSVAGAYVISAENNITYYRKQMMLAGNDSVQARIRLSVDDQAEIYVNGILVAGQYTGKTANWKNPPFDVLFKADGSVVNPNLGDAMDYTTGTSLDAIFTPGMNTIVVALRNFRKAGDKGGFSMRMDMGYDYLTGDCNAVDSCVSDSSWSKSTVVTSSNLSGFWGGVSSLPAVATYTLPAEVGQPYGFHSIDSVSGARVIKTGNNITYFRKEFKMSENMGVDARFRMTVDDAMEIYINGHLIAREENVPPSNRRSPAHDLTFVGGAFSANGYAGGDMFDWVTTADLDTVFKTGMNDVVLAVRNFSKAGDKGGFSFRMDLTKGGASVVQKSAITTKPDDQSGGLVVDVYPNPTNGILSIDIPAITGSQNMCQLAIFDMNGRMLLQQDQSSIESQIDISNFPAGIYLLRVSNTATFKTIRIIKQ